MKTRSLFLILFLFTPALLFAAQPSFRDKYNAAAKEMVPLLQTTQCMTKPVKSGKGKTIIECELQLPNGLLTLDALNNKLVGVWLMFDSSQLSHPADLMHSGGMLLRAARGKNHGNYLSVSSDTFHASRNNDWKEACTEDKESASRFCVSSDDKKMFHLTLEPINTRSNRSNGEGR